MQVVTAEFIKGKKVLLRLDIDVPIENGQVKEDFRLRAGLSTLKLCLEYALEVIVIGHIGRPNGVEVKELSVKPVSDWLEKSLGQKVNLLENLRFDSGEESGDEDFARELAQMGDVYVNEAFASYNPAVSTTILPTLLPHAAGLRFTQEVEKLTKVRENPQKPFIVIMGGAKVADKLPVINMMAGKTGAVLVGGKLIQEIREQNLQLPKNVMVGMLNGDGFDITPETVSIWSSLISKAAMIIWNGPVGKFEDAKNDATKKIAEAIINARAETVIGGGDSIAALSQYGLLQKAEEKTFVSVGGGAMLKFLAEGTLPAIEVLS